MPAKRRAVPATPPGPLEELRAVVAALDFDGPPASPEVLHDGLRAALAALEAAEARARVLETAVSALTARVGRKRAGTRVKVFGLKVRLPDGVRAEEVAAAAADLPVGLGAGEAVARLEELGLCHRDDEDDG